MSTRIIIVVDEGVVRDVFCNDLNARVSVVDLDDDAEDAGEREQELLALQDEINQLHEVA